MSQKVFVSQTIGQLQINEELYSLDKEKWNLNEDEFVVKVIFTPTADFIYYQINGQYPQEFPFYPGYEGSGLIVLANDNNLIGKYVSFFTEKEGTWKQYTKVQFKNTIFHDDCKDDEDLKNFAGSSFSNPLTAVGLAEIALAKSDVSCVINTAAGSSLASMIHKLLKSKGVETINIIRSSSKVNNLKEVLQSENVIATDSSTFNDDLQALVNKYKPTVVLDAIGGDTSGKYLKLLPSGSKMINYSVLGGSESLIVDLVDTFSKQKIIQGFFVYEWLDSLSTEQKEKIFEFVSKNFRKLFSSNIRKVFPLLQAEEALNYFMENTSLGKVLIQNN